LEHHARQENESRASEEGIDPKRIIIRRHKSETNEDD